MWYSNDYFQKLFLYLFVQNSGNYSHKISHFNWLTDWLIAFFSIQGIHTSTTIYMVYMTRTLYFISVLYWRMKVTNEGDVVSQVYTDWEVIKNPIFLTWTLQFCITHYIITRRCSSASCSCNHWAISHLFTVRVERSRLFSCQTIISIQSFEVIFPLFVSGPQVTVPAFT